MPVLSRPARRNRSDRGCSSVAPLAGIARRAAHALVGTSCSTTLRTAWLHAKAAPSPPTLRPVARSKPSEPAVPNGAFHPLEVGVFALRDLAESFSDAKGKGFLLHRQALLTSSVSRSKPPRQGKGTGGDGVAAQADAARPWSRPAARHGPQRDVDEDADAAGCRAVVMRSRYIRAMSGPWLPGTAGPAVGYASPAARSTAEAQAGNRSSHHPDGRILSSRPT